MVKKTKIKKRISKDQIDDFIIWTPRILMIFYIGLVTYHSLQKTTNLAGTSLIQGLFLYLIPTILLITFLTIAWNSRETGSYLFLALGLIFGIFFNAFKSLKGFLFLVLPIWIIAILFFVSKQLKD